MTAFDAMRTGDLRLLLRMDGCRTEEQAQTLYATELKRNPDAASDMRRLADVHEGVRVGNLFFFLWLLEPADE